MPSHRILSLSHDRYHSVPSHPIPYLIPYPIVCLISSHPLSYPLLISSHPLSHPPSPFIPSLYHSIPSHYIPYSIPQPVLTNPLPHSILYPIPSSIPSHLIASSIPFRLISSYAIAYSIHYPIHYTIVSHRIPSYAMPSLKPDTSTVPRFRSHVL